MEQNGMGDEASFKDIDREIKDIINQAAEFAQSSPEPDPSELWTDVLIEA
jgi:pyruvate dehydrogenase E1 component alpha subunit